MFDRQPVKLNQRGSDVFELTLGVNCNAEFHQQFNAERNSDRGTLTLLYITKITVKSKIHTFMAKNTVGPKCFLMISNNDITQLHKVHKLYTSLIEIIPHKAVNNRLRHLVNVDKVKWCYRCPQRNILKSTSPHKI